MTEPRWLNETQQRAWRALLVVKLLGFPEIERTFKANDLLTIQYGILTELSTAPDKTMGLSELASMSNTSQSRLTHRLRDLVTNGDIEINPCPHDGRAKNATLTASGQKRLDLVAPQHAEDVQRLFFDHLDETQTAALADALGTIAATFSDHERFKAQH